MYSSRASHIALAAALALVTLAGCRQDMHDQAKYEPLERSAFFQDHRSARPLIAGTVARGHLDADKLYYTGVGPAGFAAEVPLKVDMTLLERGRERFDIYCSPCHGRTGVGNGMIAQRGYKQPPSYFDARLRMVPPGYFYNAIIHGFGVMPSYAPQVPPDDRWAIIAYIKALQLSRSVKFDDLTPEEKAKLEHDNG